jgi:hypothetical protein
VLIEKNRETKKVVIYKKVRFSFWASILQNRTQQLAFPKRLSFVLSFPLPNEEEKKKEKRKKVKSEQKLVEKKNLLLSFLCQMITCLFELSKVLSSASSSNKELFIYYLFFSLEKTKFLFKKTENS